MDQSAAGLWDLLFGVSDPMGGVQQLEHDGNMNCVKMEMDTSSNQLELPDDFLALLSDPATQNVLRDIVSCSDFGQNVFGLGSNSLADVDSYCAEKMNTDAFTHNNTQLSDQLSQYIQMPPEMNSSTSGSGSDEDNDNHSLSSGSVHNSPRSVHSEASSTDSASSSKKHLREELKLTKEEQSLLNKEGLTLPSHYPLNKQEERTLKKIRRKIRNKKSAQESRRKKKVYVDQLEDQVKDVTGQNKTLHKRVKDLEKENTSLQAQLKTLQSVLGRSTRNTKATGTCLMALVLSVALIVTPYGKSVKDQEKESLAILTSGYEAENVTPVQSRLLYNLNGIPPDISKTYGIPLASPFKSVVVLDTPISDSANIAVGGQQWDDGYRLAIQENQTIEIPRKAPETALF